MYIYHSLCTNYKIYCAQVQRGCFWHWDQLIRVTVWEEEKQLLLCVVVLPYSALYSPPRGRSCFQGAIMGLQWRFQSMGTIWNIVDGMVCNMVMAAVFYCLNNAVSTRFSGWKHSTLANKCGCVVRLCRVLCGGHQAEHGGLVICQIRFGSFWNCLPARESSEFNFKILGLKSGFTFTLNYQPVQRQGDSDIWEADVPTLNCLCYVYADWSETVCHLRGGGKRESLLSVDFRRWLNWF